MLALPAAPAPAPRRQLLVGTALACAAGAMLFGGMLAIYLRLRMRTVNTLDAEPASRAGCPTASTSPRSRRTSC